MHTYPRTYVTMTLGLYISNRVHFTLVFLGSLSAVLLNRLPERSGMHPCWCVGSGDCMSQQERNWWDVDSKISSVVFWNITLSCFWCAVTPKAGYVKMAEFKVGFNFERRNPPWGKCFTSSQILIFPLKSYLDGKKKSNSTKRNPF